MNTYKKGSNQYQRKPKADVMLLFWVYIAIVGAFTYGMVMVKKQAHIDFKAAKVAYAYEASIAGESAKLQKATPTSTPISFKEVRANKVAQYLQSKGSPLAPYSDYIVEMADKYDIPWTLSVAISGKESSFGLHNAGSYNAWGITTGKKTGPRFASYSSWEEAIERHASLISNNYRVNMNTAIQKKYCPDIECSDTWVKHVTQFQEEVNE